MKKTTFFLFMIFLAGCAKPQKKLSQDYSFLVTDGEVSKLHQSNDSLFELKCFTSRPCLPRDRNRYKILNSRDVENFTIMKLESLDTIALTTDPYPATRFSVIAFESIDSMKLGLLYLKLGLTRDQIEKYTADIDSLHNNFFFTYYSDSYLKKLSTLKKVKTKEDVIKIIDAANSDKFNPLVERYVKSKIVDLYGSGLTSEILTRTCIEEGYDPVGAGRIVNYYMKKAD